MRVVLVLLIAVLSTPLYAARIPQDPLDSPAWQITHEYFFKGKRVVFDPRVKVIAPNVAEDPMNVPIAVQVEGDARVQQILVFADFNPIRKIALFYPGDARPYVALRMRLEQSSPVRAAVLMKDGVWHLGGAWVSTTGGGCTAPGATRAAPDWDKHLGEVHGRIWNNAPAGSRVRFRVSHPMDTGLVAGTPAFYIERLVLSDGSGREYLRIETFEPVSANPIFTFDLGPLKDGGRLHVTGIDNNGNKIAAWIDP